MPAKSDPREEPAGAEYFYRRSLNARETLPAIAAGAVIGAVAFYLVKLVLQRTPLVPRDGAVVKRRPHPARTLGG
jgi:hypothetical protein